MSTSFTTSLFPGICMAYMWRQLKLTESDIAILTISMWYSHWGRRGYHQILIISNDINSELWQDERFLILRLNVSMCNFSKFRSTRPWLPHDTDTECIVIKAWKICYIVCDHQSKNIMLSRQKERNSRSRPFSFIVNRSIYHSYMYL